jgi:hypothetical protein
MTPLQRALAALIANPGATMTHLAVAAGVNRTMLYRMPALKKARAALAAGRRDMPRGERDADGNLDAFDEP